MQNRKLFVGGLHMKTDENSLKSYFERFGKVVDCIVMRDQSSKRSRGFGFVSFEESTALEEAQRNRPHKIDDKEVPPCYRIYILTRVTIGWIHQIQHWARRWRYSLTDQFNLWSIVSRILNY